MSFDIRALADLSEEDLAVLEQLSEIRAATPTELAVRMRRMTEDIEPHLKRLHTKGLVQVRARQSDYEREIYHLSPAGRELSHRGTNH
jgi:DNA-binding MarR family transcriptional regulator